MITLPIYFHNEQTQVLDDVGVDFDITDCEVRDVHFWAINAISEFKENSKVVATRIHFNGDTMLCTLPIGEVRDIIKYPDADKYKNWSGKL